VAGIIGLAVCVWTLIRTSQKAVLVKANSVVVINPIRVVRIPRNEILNVSPVTVRTGQPASTSWAVGFQTTDGQTTKALGLTYTKQAAALEMAQRVKEFVLTDPSS